MIVEVLRRVFTGIAWGGLVTFFALTVLMINDINPDVSTIWLYMLASFVIGIYYGLAAFIFAIESWSPLKKTLIHFFLSMIVYFSIALSIGWVPPTFLAISLTTVVFIVIYSVFWGGYTLYYKKIEESLNDSLDKK